MRQVVLMLPLVYVTLRYSSAICVTQNTVCQGCLFCYLNVTAVPYVL